MELNRPTEVQGTRRSGRQVFGSQTGWWLLLILQVLAWQLCKGQPAIIRWMGNSPFSLTNLGFIITSAYTLSIAMEHIAWGIHGDYPGFIWALRRNAANLILFVAALAYGESGFANGIMTGHVVVNTFLFFCLSVILGSKSFPKVVFQAASKLRFFLLYSIFATTTLPGPSTPASNLFFSKRPGIDSALGAVIFVLSLHEKSIVAVYNAFAIVVAYPISRIPLCLRWLRNFTGGAHALEAVQSSPKPAVNGQPDDIGTLEAEVVTQGTCQHAPETPQEVRPLDRGRLVLGIDWSRGLELPREISAGLALIYLAAIYVASDTLVRTMKNATHHEHGSSMFLGMALSLASNAPILGAMIETSKHVSLEIYAGMASTSMFQFLLSMIFTFGVQSVMSGSGKFVMSFHPCLEIWTMIFLGILGQCVQGPMTRDIENFTNLVDYVSMFLTVLHLTAPRSLLLGAVCLFITLCACSKR